MERLCLICGKSFITYPSINSKYCSFKCRDISYIGTHMSEDTKLKISNKLKGKTFSCGTRRKLSKAASNPKPWLIGRKFSEQRKLNISKSLKGNVVPLYRKRRISATLQGISYSEFVDFKGTENKRIRNSTKLIEWTKYILQRDNYTCRICNKRGGCLNAHHIYSFHKYPDLRIKKENGMTLCIECHRAIHSKNINRLLFSYYNTT